MRLVGLTGGIACGKSTVSRALAAQVGSINVLFHHHFSCSAAAAAHAMLMLKIRKLSSRPAHDQSVLTACTLAQSVQGFTVIDSDAIARTVVDRGRWGYRRVVRAFGSGILRSDGELEAAPFITLLPTLRFLHLSGAPSARLPPTPPIPQPQAR